jgi:hypothetical protein
MSPLHSRPKVPTYPQLAQVRGLQKVPRRKVAPKSGRGGGWDRPRPPRVREFSTWSRPHRPPPGLVWTAIVPSTITFPYARRFIIVECESSTLEDFRTSIETRYYVTDLTTDDAGIEDLFRLVHGNWSIENGLHWV